MKEYTRNTIVTAKFAKIDLFEQMGNLDPIWAKNIQLYFVALTLI